MIPKTIEEFKEGKLNNEDFMHEFFELWYMFKGKFAEKPKVYDCGVASLEIYQGKEKNPTLGMFPKINLETNSNYFEFPTGKYIEKLIILDRSTIEGKTLETEPSTEELFETENEINKIMGFTQIIAPDVLKLKVKKGPVLYLCEYVPKL